MSQVRGALERATFLRKLLTGEGGLRDTVKGILGNAWGWLAARRSLGIVGAAKELLFEEPKHWMAQLQLPPVGRLAAKKLFIGRALHVSVACQATPVCCPPPSTRCAIINPSWRLHDKPCLVDENSQPFQHWTAREHGPAGRPLRITIEKSSVAYGPAHPKI